MLVTHFSSSSSVLGKCHHHSEHCAGNWARNVRPYPASNVVMKVFANRLVCMNWAGHVAPKGDLLTEDFGRKSPGQIQDG